MTPVDLSGDNDVDLISMSRRAIEILQETNETPILSNHVVAVVPVPSLSVSSPTVRSEIAYAPLPHLHCKWVRYARLSVGC